MFNPDQARRLDQQCRMEPAIELFEGQSVIQRFVIQAEQEQISNIITVGKFYKPDVTFGQPFEPYCLHGIDNYPIHREALEYMSIEGGSIVGSQVVIDSEQHVFAPDLVSTRQKMSDLIQLSTTGYLGCALTRRGDDVVVTYGGRAEPRQLSMRALFFHNIESSNYGSFIFRQLPQMIAAREKGYDVDCYIVGERTGWFLEALNLVGLPQKPTFTIKEVCGEIFDRLEFCNDLSAEGFIDQETVACCRGLATDLAADNVAGSRKVYLSRSLSGVGRREYRHMVNEIHVERMLASRGFEIVYPETLSLAEQAKKLRNAHIVIGPSGSGMFNTIFAPAGCSIVDIETYHTTVRQHAKLYASLGHRYSFLFADMDPTDMADPICRRSIVDLNLLSDAVTWAEAGQSTTF